MTRDEISSGVVHRIPDDLATAISSDVEVKSNWENNTPLARNEWICWVEDAKKQETRVRRIERAFIEIKEGKKRPCCWPGCSHREKTRRK